MYKFIDTIESQEKQVLPSEALNINGQYIEDLIDGYRTLSVSGRELAENEVADTQIGNSDGNRYQNKRYVPRTLTVKYSLISKNDAAFRKAYNKLNGLLDTEQATLIFHDEPDKYFIGTKCGVGDVEPGINSVVGEIEFYCADPRKYSVEEKEITPSLDDGYTFLVDYKGTYPAFPVLEASFDGDNGFLGFLDGESHVLQFGNPEEADGENYERNELLTGSNHYKQWGGDQKWLDDHGVNGQNNSNKTAGSFNVVRIEGYDNLGLADMGSSDAAWNGAMKTIDIIDSNGKTGSKNLYVYMNSWFETGLMGQTGAQTIAFIDKNNRMICAQSINKCDMSGNTAFVDFWVGGDNPKIVKQVSFEPVYWESGNPFSRGLGHSDMRKEGSRITFYWYGSYPSVIVPELKDVEVAKVQIFIGQYGGRDLSSKKYVSCNYFRRVSISIMNVEKWRDVPNKFASGDTFSADCRSGTVLHNGLPSSGLGVLGNDWEQFSLKPGVNQIRCICSSWADKPTLRLRYREVYL